MTDSETPDLEKLNRELARVQDELIALSDDAFAEKFELQQRQDELRKQATAFQQDWDARRSNADLQRELAALRSQLGGIEDQKIDLAGFGGGSSEAGPGATGLGGVQLNQQMLEAQGANAVHARIGVIKGILADRGVDPD